VVLVEIDNSNAALAQGGDNFVVAEGLTNHGSRLKLGMSGEPVKRRTKEIS
jgi:hypothetical protein